MTDTMSIEPGDVATLSGVAETVSVNTNGRMNLKCPHCSTPGLLQPPDPTFYGRQVKAECGTCGGYYEFIVNPDPPHKVISMSDGAKGNDALGA